MQTKIFLTLLLLPCILISETSREGIDKLIAGNLRFQKDQMICQNQNENRRAELIDNQSPFAVIVACSDSRVAPEIIFDQGIGDLFVIRVAGNVIGPFEMESIEYAVKELGSSCILVIGHKNCGAVNAVVQNKVEGIPFIAEMIKPSVSKAKISKAKDLLKDSIEFNAEKMSELIQQSHLIKQFTSQNKVHVYAGYYDFQTGHVSIL
ncbi:MAG: Carbonic anhydrase [Chlamydiae bacterium]|nr:Carbonic anhydrase [Chlamydiota bacterium]